MNRIGEKFKELKDKNKKALITFVTAGDSTLEDTKKLVKEMERQGADLIELGIPYSDPIADGPVIQRASDRALKNKVKITDIMQTVKEIRLDVKVPLLYMLYFNCIYQYGVERFFDDCRKSGIDGVIIPDLPFEETDEIADIGEKYSIDIISFLTPTSKERIEKIGKKAKGFLYCVSSLGITGSRNSFDTDFEQFFSNVNTYVNIPTAIGFGISTTEHIRKLKKYADGLIVGSAIVKLIENSSNIQEAVTVVGSFVSTLRKAMDE
jgi:tryptophan synthase alpha chain